MSKFEFKPRTRLEHINNLMKCGLSGEAHIRTIVHQGYYAAYNQLKYEIDNRLFFPVDGIDRYEKSHQAIIDACVKQCEKLPFGDTRKTLLNRILKNFKRAKSLRLNADYELMKQMHNNDVTAIVGYANAIFDDLESYP